MTAATREVGVDPRLIESHARLSRLMVAGRAGPGSATRGVPAVTLSYVDEANGRLVVGLAEVSGGAGGRLRSFLRREVGWTSPLEVRAFRPRRHANKTRHNRPLVGGLYIQVPDSQGEGTIGPWATRGGHPGFVTCGHVVVQAGRSVYQPANSPTNNWLVGSASAVSNYLGNGASSDSAFVPTEAGVVMANQIWRTANATYNVTGYIPPPVPGTMVYMQGGATATTERQGIVCGVNVTVTFLDGGTLVHQVLANYLSKAGDSGAPVYTKGAGHNVSVVGINVGGTAPQFTNPMPNPAIYPTNSSGEYAVISSWAAVVADLGLI
jgi:hypothetical protein